MPPFKRFKTKYPGVYYIKGTSITTGKSENIFYIMYRMNGKLVEEKAGRQFQNDMTAAKASNMRAERIKGHKLPNKEQRRAKEALQRENTNRWTLNRIFQVFVESKTHLKSLKDDKIRYRLHLQGTLGEKEIEQISPFDVDRIRVTLLKTHKPATVKQVLVLLKRVINFGAGMNICQPLTFKIVMPKFDNRVTEDLTSDQLNNLLKVLDEEEYTEAANFMKMVLFSGMRPGELFKLRWKDVDPERGFIFIRDPKGIISQKIPLNKSAKNVLKNHPRIKESPYVFPGKDGKQRTTFSKPVRRIRQKAGLPKDFRPLYGLRHVYASMLASSGQVDMYTLQKLLTHKSPQMTQRYAHLHDEALKRAADVTDKLFDQVVNGEQKKVVGIDDYNK